jgi:hypothetical protein
MSSMHLDSLCLGLRSWSARRRRPRRRRAAILEPLFFLEGRWLLSQTFTVTNTDNDSSSGSLDWAIAQVNSDASDSAGSPDMIDFDITGTGPFTIEPSSSLPVVSGPVIINGYSQPGASPNTLAQGDNAVILIDVDGASAGGDGLVLTGGASTVTGLAINQFSNAIHLESTGGDVVAGDDIGTDVTGQNNLGNSNDGVFVDDVPNNTIGGTTPADRNIISGSAADGVLASGGSATGNLVAGNFIGTDATGTIAFANSTGVEISSGASNNSVGTAATGALNLISGNTDGGVAIDGSSNDNLIQGNFIGTTVTGDLALPNGFAGYYIVPGVGINAGSGNTIGGTTAGAGNVISGNGADGIDLVNSGTQDNLVEGNLIGTTATGTQPLGNQEGGISIFFGASGNTIGGLSAGAANIIANSQDRPGVNVGVDDTDNCPGNAILSNSIYNNGMLGINLGFNTTPNQNMPGGPFQGPNALQNYPVLAQAISFTGTSTVISGSLNSVPNSSFTLQFFASATADPSGFGEGQTLVGTTTVNTDSSGNASFQVIFPTAVPAGDAISSTATDSSGDTSEFSQDITAVAASPPVDAIDDSYETNENTTLTVAAPGVQANDVSADGGSFTSVLVTPTSDGTVSLSANGSFTYTPQAGFSGTDSFSYYDVENGQDSNVATVTISVIPTTLYVTNANSNGPGSFLQAMTTASESNSSIPDTILFDIPGTGPFVITPSAPLPVLAHPTIIDGFSQPGSSPNTLAQGDNAVILITVNGSVAGGDGIVLAGGDSTVEGLAINQFNNAIHLESLGGDSVTGNFIGTDSTGENAENDGNDGVLVDNVPNNTIGGTTPADRNIISASNDAGVELSGGSATGILVAGNFIGTDATGTNRLHNSDGVSIDNNASDNVVGEPGAGNLISGNGAAISIGGGDSDNLMQANLIGTEINGTVALPNFTDALQISGSGNTIGGTSTGTGNLISGNQSDGILLGGGSGNLVEGNLIGTDITGSQPLGNGGWGVEVNSSDNTIGGLAAGAGNIIAWSEFAGVGVSGGTGNAILSNSIFDNGALGIDLGENGVTVNTPGGPHNGPNELQNFPVILAAVAFTDTGSSIIIGTLNSAAASSFTLQFFASPTADPSGYGQGETLLATTTVTTNSSGNASFRVSVPLLIPAGDAVSATATDSSGDTSEFAQDFIAIATTDRVAAINDSYSTDVNTRLTVPAPGVQTNDVSSDGGSFTSVLVAGPTHGQVTLDSDGAFTYTPARNFVGTDTFTYEDVQDGQDSNVATVTITVNPKTLYVTNTNDSGPGSLRQAMLIAAGSNSPAPDTILFDIPGAGQVAPVQGALVINVDSPLPVVSHPTIIDGYSQPGSFENTLAQGDNAVIRIEISAGSSLARGNNGFVLTAAGSTIEGLSIIESVNEFASAILISGGGDDDVFGNFITGSSYGVQIAGSSGNSVGGTNPGERNVISGNAQQGILITGGSSGNAVRGNYIGTDVTGTQANGNNNGGVSVLDSPDNTIGGSASGAGNVISSNGQDGILVSSAGNGPGSPGTVIQGNDIGVDSTGELDLGNNRNGIEIVYGTGTLIGGTSSGDRNIISGNQAGVYLQNTASDVLIEGNYVGTDSRGFKAIGNEFDGVLLSGSGNTVGGTARGAGNLISGNGRAGVSDGRWSNSTGSNLIEGNLIGTDSSGTVALGNREDGIDLGTNGDTIGGTTAAARNVISANAQDGINITGPSGSELIEGNDIGTDATGTEPMGNDQFGVYITGNNNTVGGLTARAGNVIAYSGDAGVEIASGGTSNAILTNSIFANSGMGIVTNGNGTEPYPVLTSAVSTRSGTTIEGSITADSDETYLVQFFSNPHADPSGFGQGQNYLGSLYVTTDSSGAASFQFTTKSAVPMGYVLSATATSSSSTTAQFPNTTSQFSADLTVPGPSATPAAAGTSRSAFDPSSTFTVTTAAGDSSVGSLGWAIDQVDADSSDSTSRPDTINFDIPGQGPFLIQLSQSLPAITNPVIIDGFSEPGAHPNTLTRGDNEIIQIQVDGSFIGGSNGLVLAAGDSTIDGLSLTDFNSAIVVSGVSGDRISGNFLGVRPTGYNTGSNDFGVQISDGSSNTIGGAAPAARNLISGNDNWGIQISDGSTDNVVAGNEIGTNLTGSGAMGNGNGGVSVLDSPDNTIGGPASGAGNVISGNFGDGIQLSSVDQGAGSTDTVIQGNLIGLDATGAIILRNNSNGVEVDFGSGTLIGGTRPGDGNVISGNAAQGIFIQPPVTGVLIEGNDIGTNATGTAALGNSDNGILLGGGMNTVGGTSNGAGNLISGNGNDGISDGVFSFVNSVGHSLIEGNLIGTSGAGTLALPNEQDGIVLDEDGDTVGGTTAAARNIVSGNDQYGIDITNNNFGTMNVVEGNDVGTDVTGTQPLGNLQGGIYVTATDNTIGGPTVRAANVIAFNGSFGVEIDQGAVNDSILTNSINDNSGPGIVLSENGNDNQPAPALTSAVSSRSGTIVQGTLTAAPDTTYLIQLFANQPAGSSGVGSGPGQIFLLDISVTTDSGGAATFSANVKPPVEAGYTIAATATSSTGNTSAFSAAVSVTVGPASASMSDVAVGSVSDASASTLADLVLGTLTISPTDQLDTVLTDLAVDQVQAKRHASISDS